MRPADVHPWVAHGQGPVRFGIVGGPIGDWPTLRDFVQTVEELGFDSYWRSDHPLLTPDCWTTLAAVAATTRRLRLGSMVSCVFYRNPVLLARIVADVDRVSGGRVILGLGAGDLEAEFRAMGLAYPLVHERQAALASPCKLSGDCCAAKRSPIRVLTVWWKARLCGLRRCSNRMSRWSSPAEASKPRSA